MKHLYLKYHLWLNITVLIIASFAVFSNNYKHDYPLDCGHLLLENPSVRSLKNIPQYFLDGRTLSILPANIDYRPVLQITYALNYAISKYDTWSWHLVQILLHIVCVLGLYFLCWRILREFHPDAGAMETALIPFVVGLLFAVHPTTSGVINYLSARSSLLVAAFLLPSFVLYMRPVYHGDKVKVPALAAVLYALALFTKIEAIGSLAVYFLYDALQIARQRSMTAQAGVAKYGGFIKDVVAALNIGTLKKLWLFVAITAVYAGCYVHAMSGYNQAARHAADMTPMSYLFTQTAAWWHYVFNWFAPVKLIADDLAFPVFHSIFAPQVLLALSGWIVVAALLSWFYPRYAYLTFLTVSALALISPTSSISPLAEMVNEHRPYLPLAMLSIAWLLPSGLLASRMSRAYKPAAVMAGCGMVVLVSAFFILTFQRNKVFANEESYYADIVKKAPSSRAYLNYGLTRMQKGKYDEALKYYKMALELAPNWHIIHINMGIAYQQLGELRQAQHHFDCAVAMDAYSAFGLTYRAEFRLKQKQYALALEDLEKGLPLTREYFRVYKAMACAYAGLGQWEKSLDYVKKCAYIDPRGVELEIVGIAQPYWESPDRYQPGINFFQGLDKLFPNRWWVYQNIGDLALKLGMPEMSRNAFEESRRLQQANGQKN
jgi:protein O-mannosyl-transferase